MPKTFWEDWLWGPHDPKARSVVGRISWGIVQSTYWEYLFLIYILFNAAVKLTYLRILVRLSCLPCVASRLRLLAVFLYRCRGSAIPFVSFCAYSLLLTLCPGVCARALVQPKEHTQLLKDVGLYACIIFNTEWIFEFLTYGYNDFFADNWYKADTLVNLMNWGSFLRDRQILNSPVAYFFPNIAFLRMLRFLKPLGRVKLFFPSKVVVKTVAAAMQSMGPVLSLVGFALFFFGVAGIYIFGKAGDMYYRCGVAMYAPDAKTYYNASGYKFTLDRGMQVQDCTIDMARYHEFLRLLGKKVLGHESFPEDAEEQHSNMSQVVESMANFSVNASASAAGSRRRLFSTQKKWGTQRRSIEVMVLTAGNPENPGVFDTLKPTKLEIIVEEPSEDTCPDTNNPNKGRPTETYVVDGEKMNLGGFLMSEAYKGRYLWLAQERLPLDGGRRSGSWLEDRRNEKAHEEGPSFGNFDYTKCIVMQPPKICT